MNRQQTWLFDQARRREIVLESSQVETLCSLAELVWTKGTHLGLSGRKSFEEILEKDILDSLLLVPLVLAHPPLSFSLRESNPSIMLDSRSGNDMKVVTLLDIGSGAGFPGIPLKVAVPSLSVTLLEAKQKGVRFLEEARGELNLDFDICLGRAEELKNGPNLKGSFDAVTGRAVAPLARFLGWGAPFLKSGGKLILQKGKKWEVEMNEAKPLFKKLKLTLESVLPGLEGEQKIMVLRNG